MGLKAEQSQKQSTVVTQRLIQNLEVLQMSSLELEEYICNEATDNPVIDIDAFQLRELRSKEEWLRQNDRSIGGSAAGQDERDPPDAWEPAEKRLHGSSLQEHLRSQLYSLRLSESDRLITNYLIYCVDSKDTFLRYKSFLFNCKMNTQVFLSGFINEILISVDTQQNTNKYIGNDRNASTIGK